MTRPTVPLLAISLVLAACGGDEQPIAAPTLEAVPSEAAPVVTATPTVAPSPLPAPTVTSSPTANPGDGLELADDGTEPASGSAGPQDVAAPVDAREAVVLAWLAAVHDGDVRAAWALTGPATKERLDETPDPGWHSDLAEGVGAYHDAAQRRTLVLVISEDMAVVTIHGQVTREGMTEFDVAALPVVRVQDEWKVEWRAASAPIDWEVGGDLGQVVTAVGPPVAGIHLWVEDEEVQPDVELDDSGGDPRARVSTVMADPGAQVVTVAFVGDLPGVLQADATLYP